MSQLLSSVGFSDHSDERIEKAERVKKVKIKAHSPEFRSATRAMALGGFSAFSSLYGLQPLMPLLSADLHISATATSGVVSVASAGLALSLIPASILAGRFGLKTVMSWALALTALMSVLAACSSGLTQLLICRGLMGIALAGFPAIGMAYLSEEIEPLDLGRSMGLYIAGNALGGLCGRLLMAFLAEWISWRLALGLLGVLGLLVAFEFWRTLPESNHFQPKSFDVKAWWSEVREHWSDGGLPWLFMEAFLLMGCYVSLYNYVGYRLVEPPFRLSPSWLGLVSSVNIVGMFASTWAGNLADRYSRRNVLWIMVGIMVLGVLITLSSQLLVLIMGAAIFTFGFFGAHSVASSWVGRRAHKAKAVASSFYLCAYYLGASSLGSVTGLMWERYQWVGVVGFLTGLLLICMAIAVWLRGVMPKEVVRG